MPEIYIPSSVLFSNRRVDQRNSSVYRGPFRFENTLRGLHAIQHPDDQHLRNIEQAKCLWIYGGDGTIQLALNLIESLGINPTILLLGGGSANTVRNNIHTAQQVAVPDNISPIVPSGSVQAYEYVPPVIGPSVNGQLGNQQTVLSYLADMGHLGVQSSINKEEIVSRRSKTPISLAYIAAALQSLTQFRNRIEPENIVLITGGRKESITGHVSVCSMTALPVLATFMMKDPIISSKIRTIIQSAESKPELAAKYALALIVGALINIDAASRMNLIQIQDVDGVLVTPHEGACPNACFDGELVTSSGPQIIQRGTQTRTFVVFDQSLQP